MDWGFLKQFVLSPGATGAIAPSSARLATTMVEWIDWNTVKVVVELGVGTGAFTGTITARKSSTARYIGVELNPKMCEAFVRRFPGLTLHRDSVANLPQILEQEQVEKVDVILCGLPWASFSSTSQDCFMNAITKCLGPGGLFATFAYLHGVVLPSGIRFRRLLHERFREVRQSAIVWRNLPPAFVYRCTV